VGAILDPEYESAAAQATAAGAGPADPLKMPLEEARAIQQRYFAFLGGTPPAVAAVTNHQVAGPEGSVPVRLYFPGDARPLPVIVFVRGAGWWAGNLDSHDRTMRLLALKSGFAVCGVDYRCAPEARFPTQLNELVAVVRWLQAEGKALGIDPARIVLMGESAGANLSVLAAASPALSSAIRGLVLFYGNFGGPTPQTRAYSRWVWANYLGTESLPPDPAAVPVNADMSRLPPTWLAVGDCDPLVTDTLELAEKLAAAGVPHEVKRYPGVPHAFVMLSRLYPGADAAIGDAAAAAGRFVQRVG
jgi:acetyl esterase